MMKYDLENKLLPIQKKLIHSKKMYAGICSSRATGKTWIMSWIITLALMKGQRVLAFSQTYSSLKQNLFPEIIKRFQELQLEFPEIYDKLIPQYNRSDMTVSYNGGICFGYTYENTENVNEEDPDTGDQERQRIQKF